MQTEVQAPARASHDPSTIAGPRPGAPAPGDDGPLMRIENLAMHFPVRGGVLMRARNVCRAVDGVTLEMKAGETLGLVGESGCGKTTLSRCVVRLLEPTGGKVLFRGQDITTLGNQNLKPLRRQLQMVFQDPAESLNPRHTVSEILQEPLAIHGMRSRDQRRELAGAMLERVGMRVNALEKYPFEFSGGQRQRIGIARALMLNPALLVCDEPVSALDVSVQSQVLNLLLELQRERGLGYLFVAHNLAVVRHVSDRIAIMYLGKVVEVGPSDDIYTRPRHAYTKALVAAIPIADPAARKPRMLLKGDVPSPINPPDGCAFGHRMSHPRWQESTTMDLSLRKVAPDHWVQPCPCCTDL